MYDLPIGDGHWKRLDGNWSILVQELSHSYRDAYTGWRFGQIVNGLVSDLPHGGWVRGS